MWYYKTGFASRTIYRCGAFLLGDDLFFWSAHFYGDRSRPFRRIRKFTCGFISAIRLKFVVWRSPLNFSSIKAHVWKSFSMQIFLRCSRKIPLLLSQNKGEKMGHFLSVLKHFGLSNVYYCLAKVVNRKSLKSTAFGITKHLSLLTLIKSVSEML